MDKKELIILGAGPGGYAAAFLAADLGMRVTLIDKEANPGGVCLYRGCIPSKALLHAAKVITEAKEAGDFGIDFGKPKIDAERLTQWKDDVVKKLTGGLGQLSKQRKIEYIQGTAKFKDSKTLELTDKDNKTSELGFENIIIAAGSVPAVLPNVETKSKNFLDSTSGLDIKDIPKTLLIVGGGYIGLELGTVYAALGTKVTVVEMLPQLLNGADRDLVSVLLKRIKENFSSILLETKVVEMKEGKNNIKVKFESKDGKQSEEVYDKVLISIGRKPNSKNLGLEEAGIKLDEKGFIKTNELCKTNIDNIYAIGDIAGEPMLAHKASHEGRTAVEVIAGHKAAFEPAAIPAVVFTDPEIAWCGLTEDNAKKEGREVEVAKFPWAALGRTLTLGRTDGMTKLIIEPKTERILGVGIVGPNAGDLIAEGVLAVEMAANATDLKMSIHPHPTLSESMMEAAEVFFGQSTHIYKPKKK